MKKTPSKTESRSTYHDHYDRRGQLRRSTPKNQSVMGVACADQDPPPEPRPVLTTPKKRKTLEQLEYDIPVRRSPRRKPEFSKLTISGSAIVNGSGNRSNSLKRQPSFTVLDPTSGIPSAGDTLRLGASLTSRSFHLTGLAPRRYSAPTSNSNKSPNDVNAGMCDCFGLPRVCDRCTGNNRRSLKAARAGTPGFRPPEVLLKCEHQTTAVDVWAAGVVMLCMMTRTYPFFRASDDLVHLAEIVCLFGSDAVREAACQYQRKLVLSESRPPLDWRVTFIALATRTGCNEKAENLVTKDSLDLLDKLLKLLSNERITAQDALKHPIFHRKL